MCVSWSPAKKNCFRDTAERFLLDSVELVETKSEGKGFQFGWPVFEHLKQLSEQEIIVILEAPRAVWS